MGFIFHCVALKSANDNETARSQRQHTLIPSKPMVNIIIAIATVYIANSFDCMCVYTVDKVP